MLQPLQVRVKRARYVSIWTHTGQTRPGPLSLLLCFRAAYLVKQRAGPLWLKLCVARRRASCVLPFGMALRALMARFKMAAVNNV
jgi:hypothetical protein